MQSILKQQYGFFLFVLLLTSIELFIWFYLEEVGLLELLVLSDKSYVSVFIIVLYILTSAHFVYSAFVVSRQFLEVEKRTNKCNIAVFNRFFEDLHMASVGQINPLLDILDTRLRSRYAFGFIVADLMLKLGLLGTVIGFIIMLGSLSNLNSVDITVMQKLLGDMSSGMKIALFTTLTGMLAGIFLNLKYNFLDWATDHLLNDLKEFSLSLPARHD